MCVYAYCCVCPKLIINNMHFRKSILFLALHITYKQYFYKGQDMPPIGPKVRLVVARKVGDLCVAFLYM